MNEIAAPINTMLIVEIIGVTLFFENEEDNKHNDATAIITKLENKNPTPNLHMTS